MGRVSSPRPDSFIWVGPGEHTSCRGMGSVTLEPGDELDQGWVEEIWENTTARRKIACLDEDGELLEIGAGKWEHRRERAEEVLSDLVQFAPTPERVVIEISPAGFDDLPGGGLDDLPKGWAVKEIIAPDAGTDGGDAGTAGGEAGEAVEAGEGVEAPN